MCGVLSLSIHGVMAPAISEFLVQLFELGRERIQLEVSSRLVMT